MERVEYHTPEEKEACDYIKHKRQYDRKIQILKAVMVPVDVIDNRTLIASLKVKYHRRTGTISFAHALGWWGNYFYPGTHKKLRCTNKHALEQLRYIKQKRDPKRAQRINFTTTIAPNITLHELILYYKDVGNVGFSSSFNSTHRVKLKVIDELSIEVKK